MQRAPKWISIPKEGTLNKYFTQILQSATDAYPQFVAWLQEAVTRQISHNNVTKMLICQLAYENISDECKWALALVIHTKDLSVCISTCQNIMSTIHALSLMAQAVSQNVDNKFHLIKCFIFGK